MKVYITSSLQSKNRKDLVKALKEEGHLVADDINDIDITQELFDACIIVLPAKEVAQVLAGFFIDKGVITIALQSISEDNSMPCLVGKTRKIKLYSYIEDIIEAINDISEDLYGKRKVKMETSFMEDSQRV